jgi:hypothetical protein
MTSMTSMTSTHSVAAMYTPVQLQSVARVEVDPRTRAGEHEDVVSAVALPCSQGGDDHRASSS